MATKTNRPVKGTIPYMEQQSKSSRLALLITLIMSVVNIALVFTDLDRFFLYSAWLPYFKAVEAFIYMEFGMSEATMSIVWVVVSLASGLVCWIFWNKSKLFPALAALLMTADTVYLATFFDKMGDVGEELTSTLVMNLLFHIVIVVGLIYGFVNANKLEKAKAAQTVTNQQNGFQSPEF